MVVSRKRDLPDDYVQEKRGHPRPQLLRPTWTCLNGVWDFAEDTGQGWMLASDGEGRERIVVPFSPETPASGLNRQRYLGNCWYRTTVRPPALDAGRL